jgi:prepilin signal peptidase PulO-like enzyme (type II secretory pathway)
MIALLTAAGAGVIGAALAVPVAKYTARRSAAQPVTFDVPAEKAILAAVLADPDLYPAVIDLTPDAFAVRQHARLWEAIQQTAAGAPRARDKEHLAELAGQTPELSGVPAGLAMVGYASTLSEHVPAGLDELLVAGASVLAAHEDRSRFNGKSPIVEHPGDVTPLVRKVLAPTRFRTGFTAVLLGLFSAASPLLIAYGTDLTGPAAVLAGLAVAVLGVVSVVVALVDIDTMYVDLPTFWYGSAASAGLAVTALAVNGTISQALAGVWAIAGIFFYVEVLLRGYAKLRGLPMQGGGDTQILVATAGIPAALTGNLLLGIGVLLAASVLALVVVGFQRIRGRHDTDQPFAFGPYLALGWLGAWAVYPLMQTAGLW